MLARMPLWLWLCLCLWVSSATEEGEWQYFCFEAANKLGSVGETLFTELPERPERALVASDAVATPEASSDESSSSATSSGVDRFQKLKGTCFFMRVGYWTYEVCPFLRVRQYHAENGGGTNAPVHSEFSLGTHVAGSDDWQSAKQVYQQQFSAGTEGRQSMVRYMCPESRRDEDGIVVVHEPKEKQYIFTVRVAILCTIASDSAAPSEAPAPTRTQTDASTEEAEGQSAQIAEMVVPQMRLLSSLKGRCFQLTKDYWTYEFCPAQHVRQYRQEGTRTSADTLLGSYDADKDRLTLGVRGRLDKALVPHTFTQNYVNGTGSRAADVRARCSTKNEHSLLAVEEPTMHHYVLLFLTPLACEINCAYSRPKKTVSS